MVVNTKYLTRWLEQAYYSRDAETITKLGVACTERIVSLEARVAELESQCHTDKAIHTDSQTPEK